jgi:hypothetical protein
MAKKLIIRILIQLQNKLHGGIMSKELNELLNQVGGSLKVDGTIVTVLDESRLKANIGKLVEASALGSGGTQGWSRYLVRAAALALGIVPASIHDLYLAQPARAFVSRRTCHVPRREKDERGRVHL